MNFVLFHFGNKLPDHFKYCVKQIQLTNPNSQIYIITNLNVVVPDPKITIVPTHILPVPNIGDYYLYDPMGELFRNSMLRLYYLESFMDVYKIGDIIHFDNDILIYENVNEIKNTLRKHDMLITAHHELDYVFGFSYIKNTNKFKKLNAELLQLVIKGEKTLEPIIGSMPHEMRLMNYVNANNNYELVDLLPIFPFDETFFEYNYCFDPSSYGQFLGGAKADLLHYIGRAILTNKVKVVFDKKPKVIYNNKEYKLFNLHVHNKKLENFIL